jgi:hypothetical protein
MVERAGQPISPTGCTARGFRHSRYFRQTVFHPWGAPHEDFSIYWYYRQGFADGGGSGMRHVNGLASRMPGTARTEARQEATMVGLEADAASLVHASI